MTFQHRSAYFLPQFETLERKLPLAGDTACPLDIADLPQGDTVRAAHAVNCFAFDLYRHFGAESGNLFLSPLSISTALTMAYAGAAGETAAEMERVLHLGSEPGIHESFEALLDSLVRGGAEFDLQLANAQWPQAGFPIKQSFLDQIATQYDGHTESLDYANETEASRATINQWVEDNTNGRIEELIKRLGPDTVMVLTNAIFYRAFWGTPFDPEFTSDKTFTLHDGKTKTVPMMFQPAFATPTNEDGELLPSYGYGYSEHGNFRVLEMPYEGADSSMVILLPKDGHTTDALTAETLASVNQWLASSPERRPDYEVTLPKFKTTVSSALEGLLPDMGMPLAFSDADFSKMTDAPVVIDQVGHKAFLEVNEQGTEAAAATFVSFVICFAKGTTVLTADGEKPIEEIRAGDYVLSRDEHNLRADIEPMLVEETFHNSGKLLALSMGGRVIRATPEHPFYVRDQGWTKAGDLQPGDMLSCDLNSWIELTDVTEIEGEHAVYNFRVAQHHTYFVGGRDFGFSVWTHNACGEPDPQFIVDRPFHFFIRDNTTSAMLFMGRISDPLGETENELVPQFQEEKPVLGDANGDQKVNFADFLILSANFGKQVDAVLADGDFDSDGAVTFADFLILSQNFQPDEASFESSSISRE